MTAAIAWYTVQPAAGPCQTHFVEIATGAVSVHDSATSMSTPRSLRPERARLQGTRDFVGNFWGGPTRLQLIDTAMPGTVLTEATATPGSHFTETHLSDAAPCSGPPTCGGG